MPELEPEVRTLRVADIVLDLDNPRFFHKGPGLTQDQIEEDILNNNDDIHLLTKTIQKDGVQDPIWVVPQSNGKYLVVEGNRRTVVLRRLLKDRAVPPAGVKYDVVRAHVLPPDTP